MARWRCGVALGAALRPGWWLLCAVLLAGALPGAISDAQAQGSSFLAREPGPQPGVPHDGEWFSYRCVHVQVAYGCNSTEASAQAVFANVQAAVTALASDTPQALCPGDSVPQGLALELLSDWATLEAQQKYYGYGLPGVWYPYVSADDEVLETSRDFRMRYRCGEAPTEHSLIYQVQKRRILVCPEGTTTLFQGCLLRSALVQSGKNNGACCPVNPASNAPKVSNPIQPATGNKYQRETDYVGAGAFPLTFTRHYNSFGRVREARIGRQWRHSFARELVLRGNTVTVYRADGAGYYFTRGAHGLWYAQSDVMLRLSEQHDGEGTLTGWQLRLRDDTREDYDASGRWLRIANRAGLAWHASYDAQGRLSAVSDDFGRTLSLHYEGEDAEQISSITDPGGNRIGYRYDAAGRLVAVEHVDAQPVPSTRSYHYEDGAHPYHLTGVTDERGVRTGTWAYDAQGRAIHGMRADGADAVAISYLPDNQVQVHDALGRSTTYQFQVSLGTVRTAASAGDPCRGCPRKAAAIAYDARGYPTSVTDLNGVVTHHSYDARGLEVSRREAVGTPLERTITTQWHSVWRQPVRIEQAGQVSEFAYDAAGRLLVRTLRDTATGRERSTHYAYNALGLIASIDGPRTDVADVTTFSYDAQGNLAQISNALGHVSAFTAHDAHGRVLAMVDANGLETTFAYDTRGRLIAREVDGLRSELVHDAAGNLIRVSLPDSSTLDYQYDGASRLVALSDALGNRIEYELDALGNRTAERVLDADGVLARTRSRVFDTLGRLVEQIGGEGDVQSYAYDAMDRLLSHTDARGSRTEHTYDALARLASTLDALGGLSRFTYDARDNLVAVTDAGGARTEYTVDGLDDAVGELSPDAGATGYSTDAAGNRLTRTDAREITAHYSYDALNRVTQVRYPDPSQDIVYTFDSAPNGIGRLGEVADASGVTAYAYDLRGNLVSETRSIAGHSYTVHYAYDALDRIASITYPSGMRIEHERDVAGRVVAVRRVEDGTSSMLASDIDYAADGQARAWTLGNGHGEQRSFNRDGRVLDITVPGVLERAYRYDAGGNITAIDDLQAPEASQAFGYDALDRLTQASSGVYGALAYDYDAVGNRLRRTSPTGVDDYTYEALSNRLLEIAGPNAQVFTYDAAGNTTSRGVRIDVYDAAGRLQASAIAGVEQARYSYNANGERVRRSTADGETIYLFARDGQLLAEADDQGRITREHVTLHGQPLALIVRRTQAAPPAPSGVYHAHGGRWNRTGEFAVEFDPATSALTVRRNGEVLFSHAKGTPVTPHKGRYRVHYRLPHGKGSAHLSFVPRPADDPDLKGLEHHPRVHYLLSSVTLLLWEEVDKDKATKSKGSNGKKGHGKAKGKRHAKHQPEPRPVLYRGRNLAFHEQSTTDGDPVPVLAVYYHHLDHLGTPQALTDESGALAWQAHYLPFGQTLETIADIEQPIRFPGQFVDDAAGAVYNYQRWYESGTGRYLRSDPIGLAGGINTYVYANANALRFNDRFGLNPSGLNPRLWVRFGQAIVGLLGLVKPPPKIPRTVPLGPLPNHPGTKIPIDVPLPPGDVGVPETALPEPLRAETGDGSAIPDAEDLCRQIYQADIRTCVILYGPKGLIPDDVRLVDCALAACRVFAL